MFTFYIDAHGYPWTGNALYRGEDAAWEVRVPEDLNAAIRRWKDVITGRPTSIGLACTFWVNVGRDRISGPEHVVDAMIREMGRHPE